MTDDLLWSKTETLVISVRWDSMNFSLSYQVDLFVHMRKVLPHFSHPKICFKILVKKFSNVLYNLWHSWLIKFNVRKTFSTLKHQLFKWGGKIQPNNNNSQHHHLPNHTSNANLPIFTTHLFLSSSTTTSLSLHSSSNGCMFRELQIKSYLTVNVGDVDLRGTI